MFLRQSLKPQVIYQQPYGYMNSYPMYRQSDWDHGEGPHQGGGFILPLIAGGITGAVLAAGFNQNNQPYSGQGYPVQNYPVQNYPVPMPVPYYQPYQNPSQPTNYPSPNIIQTNTYNYPNMPSIQSMSEDGGAIQKQGKAYLTHPVTPTQQLTSLMPYYMFSMRF